MEDAQKSVLAIRGESCSSAKPDVSGSRHSNSTREKCASSGSSKIYPVKASCIESPSSAGNVFLNGFGSRVAPCSEEFEKEIAARAVALVVSQTRRGKTGIVSLCSLVGNLLKAKMSLNHEVLCKKQEIKQLKAILDSMKTPCIFVSSSSSESNEPIIGLKTAATQTKGDCKRLTCEKSTYTIHLAENRKQVDVSSKTDTSSNETDSSVSINIEEKLDVSSKTESSGNETGSSVCSNPSNKFNMSSQTDTSEEETDGSHYGFVYKACQRCGSNNFYSSLENCWEFSEVGNHQPNSVDKKRLKACEGASCSEDLSIENLQEQLKTAMDKVLEFERKISTLNRELWVLRRKTTVQQSCATQSGVQQSFASNKQDEVEAVETLVLPPSQPTRRAKQEFSNQYSTELPHLDSRVGTSQLVSYNMINSAKHKGTRTRITRSKKIFPALDVNSQQRNKHVAKDGWMTCSRHSHDNTLPFSALSGNREQIHDQRKRFHARSRQKVLPNVGDRVIVEGEFSGVVKYLGPIDNTSKVYVGLHLDAPVGKGNGSLNGKAFFTCPKHYCRFAPVDEVLCIVSQSKAKSSGFEAVSRKRS